MSNSVRVGSQLNTTGPHSKEKLVLAGLAPQWMKERIITISAFVCLVARLAREYVDQNTKRAASSVLNLVLYKPLPGILGNTGSEAFIFREQGILSNYLQGTREFLIRLLGSIYFQL